jgi:CBS domain-containing protein
VVRNPRASRSRRISNHLNVRRMTKTVADIMTREPISVRPETPIQTAIEILAKQRISGLPVLDDDGKLVGVISESDLMWRETDVREPAFITILDSVIYLDNPGRYEKELHKAIGQTVGEVMFSGHVVTIAPDKSIRDAARLMHDKQVHRLPVLDAATQMLVGILTRGDIIRTMATLES